MQDTAARPHKLRRTATLDWNDDSEEPGKGFHQCRPPSYITTFISPPPMTITTPLLSLTLPSPLSISVTKH